MNTSQTRFWLRRASAAALALTLVSLLVPAAASARTEQLQWRHPDDGTVSYFRVRWGVSSRNYPNRLSVGRPRNGDLFQYSVTVPDEEDVYFTVSAIGYTGLESVYSNEILRRAPAGSGGTPAPSQLGTPGRPRVISN